MSLLATPSRGNRGLPIANLDTKPSIDDAVLSMAYGLNTPPNSAIDAHRPSVQYPWFEDSFPPPMSVKYSPPNTPVHHMQDGNIHTEMTWTPMNLSDSYVLGSTTSADIVDSSMCHQIHQTPSMHRFVPSVGINERSSLEGFGNSNRTNLPHFDSWQEQRAPAESLALQSARNGAELFSMSRSTSTESDISAYHSLKVALTFEPASFDGLPSTNYGANILGEPFSHQSQIVVPSQLTPHDVSDQSSFEEYHSPGGGMDQCRYIFPSPSPTIFGSFQTLNVPELRTTYPGDSVEHEYNTTDSDVSYDHPRQHLSAKRRNRAALKRKVVSRKISAGDEIWHKHETTGIEVNCKGKKFDISKPIDQQTLPIHLSKPIRCEHVDENGEMCVYRSKRQEHLTRHQRQHTGLRPYRCVFSDLGCKNKATSRSDNAWDHLITHLKPKTPGVRNYRGFSAQQALDGIAETYKHDPKQASKMEARLRQWLASGAREKAPKRKRQA